MSVFRYLIPLLLVTSGTLYPVKASTPARFWRDVPLACGGIKALVVSEYLTARAVRELEARFDFSADVVILDPEWPLQLALENPCKPLKALQEY